MNQENTHDPAPCVMALGTFDGMHPGHLAVIDRAVSVARSMGLPACVYTFCEIPRSIFASPVQMLMSPQEKERAMYARGVDKVFMAHFTKELAQMSPEDFAGMLKDECGAQCVVTGEDYTFGCRAQGNVNVLRTLGARLGFRVVVVEMVTVPACEGSAPIKISSTAIREALERGETDAARALLNGKTK